MANESVQPSSSHAHECGAQLVEFALVLAILAAIFLFGSIFLRDRGEERFQSSTQVVNDIVPCGETIGGQDCL